MTAIGRNTRSAQGDHFGWHPGTGPDVDERDGHVFVNNLLAGDTNFNRPLLFTWQTPSLCERLPQPQLTQLDHNVYVRSADSASHPPILWSPASNENCQAGFESLEELRKAYPKFAANSQYFKNYAGPLFKSMELGNYQLLPKFPGMATATPLPAEISRFLNRLQKENRSIGAYPPMP
jgi:hypothetical protein